MQILQQKLDKDQKEIQAQKHLGGVDNLSKDNVDDLVYCQDPISQKIVHLVAKYKALDDCMSAV